MLTGSMSVATRAGSSRGRPVISSTHAAQGPAGSKGPTCRIHAPSLCASRLDMAVRKQPTEQADIVKNYLGPAFVSAGINTKILVWDHNWSEAGYPLQVLSDASARAFVAGSA